MGLPTVDMPTGEVTLSDGQTVQVRGLTRAEVQATDNSNAAALDVALLVAGCGVDKKEAQAWCKATPSTDVGAVVMRVLELSGLRQDSPKASGPSPED